MGLLKKLTAKLNKPKDFVFENFKENFENNQKFLQKQFKKMEKGYYAIIKRDDVEFYMSNSFDKFDDFVLDIMEITNSECFSSNFANIVTFAKVYALNYIATYQGKTDKESEFAVARLSDMIDCLNFNYLAHVNCETELVAEYKDGKISVEKDSYAEDLIKMVNAVNNVILKIAEGIDARDRDAVLEGYMDLHNEELYKFAPNSEDVFGL